MFDWDLWYGSQAIFSYYTLHISYYIRHPSMPPGRFLLLFCIIKHTHSRSYVGSYHILSAVLVGINSSILNYSHR